MATQSHTPRRLALLLSTVLSAATLSACNKPATPQAAAPMGSVAVAEAPPAPSADALPPAPPAPVGRVSNPDDSYGYLSRAYYVDDAFGDSAPDYGFDYDGTEPWVWRADHRGYRVVERLSSGDRYYYYDDGADQPYLVRDPDYAYGYDNGQLVVVYDSRGRLMSSDYARQRADYAGRYLYRARALSQAARQERRAPVPVANWNQRRAAFDADRARQDDQRRQDDQWRAYNDRHAAQQQAQWADERGRRQALAAQQQQQAQQQRQQQEQQQGAQRDQRSMPPVGAPPQQRGPDRGQADQQARLQADRAQRDAGIAKAQAQQAQQQAAQAQKAQVQAQSSNS
jgi:hypothetical protein